MTEDKRLQVSLLALRIGVAIVMVIWTIEKFHNPAHITGILEHFYGMQGWGANAVYALGAAQALLVLGFTLGVARTWTYGAVLIMHAATTFASYKQYLDPFDGANILFYAAWPMLAACLALFLLRRRDNLLSFGK